METAGAPGAADRPLSLQTGARGRAALTPGPLPDAVGLDPRDLAFLRYRVQNFSGKIDDLLCKRQIAPWCAGSQHPAEGVEDESIVHTRHASRHVRQHRPDGRPFIVREFVADHSRLQFGSFNRLHITRLSSAKLLRLDAHRPIFGFFIIR
jgi:hypothetical protein